MVVHPSFTSFGPARRRVCRGALADTDTDTLFLSTLWTNLLHQQHSQQLLTAQTADLSQGIEDMDGTGTGKCTLCQLSTYRRPWSDFFVPLLGSCEVHQWKSTTTSAILGHTIREAEMEASCRM